MPQLGQWRGSCCWPRRRGRDPAGDPGGRRPALPAHLRPSLSEKLTQKSLPLTHPSTPPLPSLLRDSFRQAAYIITKLSQVSEPSLCGDDWPETSRLAPALSVAIWLPASAINYDYSLREKRVSYIFNVKGLNYTYLIT